MSEWSSAAAPVRVAVIDTDSGFIRVLVKRLERLGWEHRVLATAPSVEHLVGLRPTALVVDPGSLGPRGMAYVEHVCAALPGLAVVVCTPGATVAERVQGLRAGADDWLGKPCHPEELIARIEAVVRRRDRQRGDAAPAEPVLAGELEIRPDRFEAFVAGRPAGLTRREFELLALLARADGRVLEREDIYRRVWGYEMARGDRSVDVFVRKLRQKLRIVSGGFSYVHTHFGVGYRFAPEPAEEAEAEPAVHEPESVADPLGSAA